MTHLLHLHPVLHKSAATLMVTLTATPMGTVTLKANADEVANEQVNNIEAIRSTTTFSHLPNHYTTKVLVCGDD